MRIWFAPNSKCDRLFPVSPRRLRFARNVNALRCASRRNESLSAPRRGPSMYSRLLHICLSVFVLSVFLSSSAAQDKEKPGQPGAPPPQKRLTDDEEDYRRLFKRPTNTAEYWKAMQFEIEVGKYDLAAIHLRNLINFKPPDADLVKLADE